MGLTSSLAAAASGLRITQAGVSLAAQNVANVDSPGYTRKTLVQSALTAGDQVIGVSEVGLARESDSLLTRELRIALPANAYAETSSEFYGRVDLLFGSPGQDGSIDQMFNELTESLQSLTTTPESISSRAQVVADSTVLAQRLNQMSSSLQGMRLETELRIDDTVGRMNTLLQNLETVNLSITSGNQTTFPPPDLLDQRDAIITELSEYVELQVIERPDNGVTLFTSNGTLLFDFEAARLSFDGRSTIRAEDIYSRDQAERNVGTVSLIASNGYTIDLIADRGLTGGSLQALIDMRDDTLVEAQRQLDELAGALAGALSDVPVSGTAITVGAQNGFELDTTGALGGNIATLAYENTTTGLTETVSLVRVDTGSALPLSDDLTARTDDRVVGIDFSGTMADVATQIQTALGASFTVTNPTGDTIRILDDGAVGAINMLSLDAVVTSTGTTGQGLAFPLFTDAGNSPTIYSRNQDSGDQLIGFSSRIQVNQQLVSDTAGLVIYSTSPATADGDPARPQAMLDGLTQAQRQFTGATGLGGADGLEVTVSTFLRQVASYQTGNAETARSIAQSRDQIVTSLQQSLQQETGVNVDEEMARLIELQNAYAANARVISAVDEMVDILLRI